MKKELRNPVQELWQDQPVEGITMSAEIIRKRAWPGLRCNCIAKDQ